MGSYVFVKILSLRNTFSLSSSSVYILSGAGPPPLGRTTVMVLGALLSAS
jgi:hypothetical protein